MSVTRLTIQILRGKFFKPFQGFKFYSQKLIKNSRGISAEDEMMCQIYKNQLFAAIQIQTGRHMTDPMPERKWRR
jgi:hypothetical protein